MEYLLPLCSETELLVRLTALSLLSVPVFQGLFVLKEKLLIAILSHFSDKIGPMGKGNISREQIIEERQDFDHRFGRTSSQDEAKIGHKVI